MKRTLALLLAGTALSLSLGVSAADAPAKPETQSAAAHVAPPKDEKSVTHGSVTINGKRIDYTATAGTIILKNKEGKPTGSMFYVAYVKNGVRDPSTRPIAFLYNGGPGSSSVWLHMGAFGPVRVISGDAHHTPPAPYNVVNNNDSLLDVSDLVFIDAMGTGFSRIIGKDQGGVGTPKDFYGVNADGKAFAQFISDYVSRNDRWNSPKYLIGESYGTTRSAVLVNDLQQQGMDFNGVVLMSSILNFETDSFNPGNDLPYISFLPSYAAVACYHKVTQCPADLPAYLQQVKNFARGEYASALMLGSSLPAAEKAQIVQKLAQYTGLKPSYIEKADLRVNLFQFMAELQRNKDLVTGRLDGRYSGYAADQLAEYAFNDPQSDAITGAYTAAFNRYVRQTLHFGEDRNYIVLSDTVGRDWNWKHYGGRINWPGYTNVAPDLAAAMRYNPHLKVQIENGYYDLATPFYGTEYTVEHLGLPPALQKNITLNFYDCGHMLYEQPESIKQLHANLVNFIRGSDQGNR
ncbi:MAG: peptidase S10 [Pseudomonadota bacterium]|jgi:carboxypeptidase C (cathepsin A)|nr:peptidase S10 [Pseudomonadota bacterium]MDE3140830.1 peptidase S10 [Pseudomonadota bacterium]